MGVSRKNGRHQQRFEGLTLEDLPILDIDDVHKYTPQVPEHVILNLLAELREPNNDEMKPAIKPRLTRMRW